jgi:hypothetical protein
MRPAYERHKQVLQVLQRRTGRARWVLKSPVHLHSLPTLLAVYPDARLAFTHRDPAAVLASATSLLANLRWVHSDHVDVPSIGRYHHDLFARSLSSLAAGDPPAAAVHHSRYADFVERPLDTVLEVCGALGIELSPSTPQRMAAHLASSPQGRHGEHRYDFDDLGLDRASVDASFASYRARFTV